MKKTFVLMIAMLCMIFAIAQTKTEIKPSDLSRNLSAYIKTNFTNYVVDKAFKIDNKGTMSTQVMISNGAEQLILTFDKDFKLTKKEAIKPDLKMPPAKQEKKNQAPVATPATTGKKTPDSNLPVKK